MSETPRRSRRRPIAEINVTPFVDVMLVLLIIFMVTAPLMQQGIEITLPKTQSEGLQQKDEALVITVKRDGTLYVQETQVPIQSLASRLKTIFVSRANREVFLRADEEVAYGIVARTLAALRRAGATRIGMVTEPGV